MTLPARVGASAINATDNTAVTTGVTLECRFDGAAFAAPSNGDEFVVT